MNNTMTTLRSSTQIREWLTAYVAEAVDMDASAIDAHAPFERVGLDSSSIVGMSGDLEQWLGFEVDPTLPYDYPTVESLAGHLAQLSQAQHSKENGR
jgi:acyl carrier protein